MLQNCGEIVTLDLSTRGRDGVDELPAPLGSPEAPEPKLTSAPLLPALHRCPMGSGNSPSPSWRSCPLSPLPCCWLRPRAPPCSQPLLSNWRHPFQPPEPPDRAPVAQWPKYRWKLPSFFPLLLTLRPQSRVISLLVIVGPRFSQTTVKGNCGITFLLGS